MYGAIFVQLIYTLPLMQTEQDKTENKFVFFVPDFITKCEQRALIAFFKEYFSALEECEKFTVTEIVERKRLIMSALDTNYRNMDAHRKKWDKVVAELQTSRDPSRAPHLTDNSEKQDGEQHDDYEFKEAVVGDD